MPFRMFSLAALWGDETGSKGTREESTAGIRAGGGLCVGIAAARREVGRFENFRRGDTINNDRYSMSSHYGPAL